MPRTRAILTLLALVLTCGVVSAATNIDPAWLDNPANQGTVNGRTVYILKKAGETYSLQVDVATSGTAFYIANRDITFDLNGHAITYNTDNLPGPTGQDDHRLGAHGVVLYTNWHNTEIVIVGAATPSRATIKNGSISNANAGSLAHCVFGFESNAAVIEGLSVLTNGKDSYAIAFSWSSGGTPTINNNVLETRTSTTFNRHSGPACVRVNGATNAKGNVLIGGNSGFNVGSKSVIQGNVVAHNGFATNGYGVFAYKTTGATVADNVLLPPNGRGVIFDTGLNNTAKDNVILHLETPNAEYGDSLNAAAIRIRYAASGNLYAGNTSLGVGGGKYCGTSGLYLTDYAGPANRLAGNHATVLMSGTPSGTRYAQAISLEGQGPNSLDEIDDNTFRSNHLFIRMEGYDGYGNQAAPLVRNRFELVTVPQAVEEFIAAADAKLKGLMLTERCQAVARGILDERAKQLRVLSAPALKSAFWFAKYWDYNNPVHITRATLQDSVFGNGVDARTWETNGAKSAGSLDLRVREGDRDLFAITKEAAVDAPIVLTDFGPPPVLKRLRIVSGDLRVGGEIVVEELE